jgi:hypothetical protein
MASEKLLLLKSTHDLATELNAEHQLTNVKATAMDFIQRKNSTMNSNV